MKNIPEDIKQAAINHANESEPNPVTPLGKLRWEAVRDSFLAGYSLSLQTIQEKDEEIKRLTTEREEALVANNRLAESNRKYREALEWMANYPDPMDEEELIIKVHAVQDKAKEVISKQ